MPRRHAASTAAAASTVGKMVVVVASDDTTTTMEDGSSGMGGVDTTMAGHCKSLFMWDDWILRSAVSFKLPLSKTWIDDDDDDSTTTMGGVVVVVVVAVPFAFAVSCKKDESAWDAAHSKRGSVAKGCWSK